MDMGGRMCQTNSSTGRSGCSPTPVYHGPRRGTSDEEFSANILGKFTRHLCGGPCVKKLQARFDEEALETYSMRVARQCLTL